MERINDIYRRIIRQELQIKLKDRGLEIDFNHGDLDIVFDSVEETLDNFVEYIFQCNDFGNVYTIDDWIKDTTSHYPEIFK